MLPVRPNRHSDDPLTRVLRPPVDETPPQRDLRIKAEREALRISQEIDEELSRERADKKKFRPEVRVLLLGTILSLLLFSLAHQHPLERATQGRRDRESRPHSRISN